MKLKLKNDPINYDLIFKIIRPYAESILKIHGIKLENDEMYIKCTGEFRSNYIKNFSLNILDNCIYLSELDGCCGVCISHNTNVYWQHRNKKIGNMLFEMKKELAKAAGYTIMLTTHRTDVPAVTKILEKNKRKHLYSFVNRRTSNEVQMSVINLQYE